MQEDPQSLVNRLLCTVARVRDSAHFTELLERHPDGIDWEQLVQSAYRHGVAGLLCHHLVAVPSERVPDEMASAAAGHLEQRAVSNQAKADQLCAVIEGLSAHGIDAIPFKGPTLAESAYGDLALRAFADLDLLVRDAEAAIKVLNELGYEQLETDNLSPRQRCAFLRYSGQDILFGTGAPIEPHWTFAPHTFAFGFDYPGLWARASRRPFNGVEVLGLAPEDEWLVLCAHGAKERWPTLKFVADVAVFLDSHPDLDWDQIRSRARAQGLARLVVIGIRLANRLVDLPVPEELGDWLKEDKAGCALADKCAADFFVESAPRGASYDLTRFHLAMRERRIDQARYLLRTLTQPRISHFNSLPLPDPLFPLYWPYKLVHDYLAMPVWRLSRNVMSKNTGSQANAAG